MGAYGYSLHESIDEVDPGEWNRLRRPCGDVFMTPPYLRAVENALHAECRFFYVVVRDEAGRPVATACFSLYSVDATLLAGPLARKLLRPVVWLLPGLLKLPVLFCGHPVSAGVSHLRLSPDARTDDVLRILDEIADRLASEHGARCIVFKEFDTEESERLAGLTARRYRRADSLPMNVVAPQWSSFDDYLADLKSRKRSTIRRSRKKFQQAGLRVRRVTGPEAVRLYTDDVHRLYDAVLEQAQVKLEWLPPAYFRRLAEHLPDNAAFTLIEDGDRVVAFAASVFTDCAYHQLFVGFDYDLNPQCDLYFNLFYAEMDAAFRSGARKVHVGQTSDTFKQQKLGCTPEPLFVYVKGADLVARAVLRLAFPWLFPAAEKLAS